MYSLLPSPPAIIEVNRVFHKRSKMSVRIEDVIVYKKKRKSESRPEAYYCQLRNPDTGAYQGGKIYSIQKLADQLGIYYPSINEPRAWAIVADAISAGILKPISKMIPDSDKGPHPLIKYVEEICTYDTSPWIRFETKRKGHSHKMGYVKNLLRTFQLHAKPFISPNALLETFTKKDALNLQMNMAANGVSVDNINTAIKAMRAAFNYAEMMDLIDFNPIASLKPYSVNRPEKDILSRIEACRMLKRLEYHKDESLTRMAVWLAARLAIFAGMREGEIRGLSISQLSRVFDDCNEPTPFFKIDVCKEWEEVSKSITPTKQRYKRITVIHESLALDLIQFSEETGRLNDTLLFKSERVARYKSSPAEKPLVKNVFQDYMYEALEEIGIDKETRMARDIDFQSLRHFYDSETKSIAHTIEVYKAEIRDAVGHKSKSVDELIYTHETTTSLIVKGVMSEHLLDIRKGETIESYID